MKPYTEAELDSNIEYFGYERTDDELGSFRPAANKLIEMFLAGETDMTRERVIRQVHAFLNCGTLVAERMVVRAEEKRNA